MASGGQRRKRKRESEKREAWVRFDAAGGDLSAYERSSFEVCAVLYALGFLYAALQSALRLWVERERAAAHHARCHRRREVCASLLVLVRSAGSCPRRRHLCRGRRDLNPQHRR